MMITHEGSSCPECTLSMAIARALLFLSATPVAVVSVAPQNLQAGDHFQRNDYSYARVSAKRGARGRRRERPNW
jgi:hypothetical protein